MATITFFSNMRAFASSVSKKSDQIRDAIENGSEDTARGTSRPPLIEKMMDNMDNIEEVGSTLAKKTIHNANCVHSTTISDVASRLQSRCSSEMASIEKFLAQYGYQRNFAALEQTLTVAEESTDCDNAEQEQIEDGSETTSNDASNDEASSAIDFDEAVQGAVGTACADEKVPATSTPAVSEAKRTGMVIGFKDEPEGSGTPSFDDVGFSALTMEMMQKTANDTGIQNDSFSSQMFEMSGRKLSLGAQSEGSPVAPEMKSVHFSRNIALTRESPAVNADSDREPAATSEGNAAPSPKVNLDFSMEADEEETRIATPPAKAAHGTPAPAKDSVAKSTPAKRTPARFTPKRAVRTPIASVEDSPKEQQAQSASPQTPGTPVPADGTPQFATSSPSAAPKSIDLSHMMQFAPKGSDSTSSDHIAAVTSAELSKVPSYLRSQFDLETLNEKLCSVNEFITTTSIANGDDPSDLIVTEEQIREHISIPASKGKAFVLLLVKLKRLRIVAKDRYTLPK